MGNTEVPVNLIRTSSFVEGYSPQKVLEHGRDMSGSGLVLQEVPNNSVDSVRNSSASPGGSPVKHLATASPPRCDLTKLTQAEYYRARAVYEGADEGPSLYDRGKKWLNRMKDWVQGKELDPFIKGVDESFGGYTKEVLLEGWQYIYDQLKGIQVIGCNFFGMHSEISKMKSGEVQMEALAVYEQMGSDFLRIIEEESAKIEVARDEALEGVEDIDQRKEIERKYQDQQKALTQGAVLQLNKFAAQMSPDLRKESDKLSKIMERLHNCQAVFLVAEDKEARAESAYGAALREFEIAGDSEDMRRFDKARKEVDRTEAAFHKARDYKEIVQSKLSSLITEESFATRRYNEKLEEIEANIGQATVGMRADAKLGQILHKEGISAASKKWTWIIGDTLWTVQEGCSVLGYLGIPVVSLVALGVSLVVKGFRSAMYMDSTIDRSKEASRAGKIGKALKNVEASDDATLGAISKLIKDNLAYKEKSIKAFVVSLSLVSTAAWTFAALAQAGVALGVTAGVVASIANPLAWGIGGIVLMTGLAFSGYQLAKYLHGYYKQHQVEKVLDDALSGLQGDKCDGYNALFMKHFESIALEDFTPEQVHKFVAIANERVSDVCGDRLREAQDVRKEAEAIAADRNKLSDGQSKAYDDLLKTYLAGLVPEGLELSDQSPEEANALIEVANAKIIEYCKAQEAALKGIIDESGQDLSAKKSDAYSNVFRQQLEDVMAHESVGREHDRIDRINNLIIEESMYELMKLKPDYGLSVLLDRVKSGDEAARNFVEQLGVFDKDELYIMRHCSKDAESLVLTRMKERLGFS